VRIRSTGLQLGYVGPKLSSTIRYNARVIDEQPSALLREARRQARLSQAELAKRAGTTQSVVSAYENAARQPSLPTLARLVAATGLELDVRVRRPRPALRRLTGPLGVRVCRHRQEIRRITAKYRLTNVRVFGSVARGEETPDSDLDLLVDVGAGVSLLTLARCQHELQSLLKATVDLVPASDLKPRVARSVAAEALPL
jgi:predicted nucleotidyltransferase/DNA-binding XRE family transcriptional regulator